MSEQKKNIEREKTARLTVSSLLLALGVVIELVSKALGIELPFGGTITLASMFPVILIAYRYGVKWGLFSSFVYSLLQMLLGAKTIAAFFMPGDSHMKLPFALASIFLDYLLAYTVLGLGGVFKGKLKIPAVELALGSIIALLARYAMHFLSGYLLFGSWAEWFFTQDNFYSWGALILSKYHGKSLSVIYSLIYNGLYMVPEIIITTIVSVILGSIPIISGVNKKLKNQQNFK